MAVSRSKSLDTVQYSPGMRLVIRDEEWMVKKAEVNSMGQQILFVVGLSPLVKDREAQFLTALEDRIDVVDPTATRLVPDTSPRFVRSRLFLESQWRQQTPTDDVLHVGHRAAMNVMQYQLEPAQMALGQTRQRVLIADAVGLGKTLEAGILMSELIARGRGKRILVVTVKSMMTQFQKEMWNRFTIPLVRLDSSRIQKVRAQIPSNHNPFFYFDRTIVSIDTLKRDVEYRTHLENAWWDIIVIDEAHNVAVRGNRQAQRSRLAQLLAERSDTLIMLSATPHDGRSESFASLMNMLDPTAIADPSRYTKEDIAGLCVRRFKKDIKDEAGGAFQDRHIAIEYAPASEAEAAAYDALTALDLQSDRRAHGGSHLFRTILEKSLFSSPAACSQTIHNRLQTLAKKDTTDAAHDRRQLEHLQHWVDAMTPEQFSRYQKLLQLLRSSDYGWTGNDTHDRLVIFTERIETMRFVADRLRCDLGLAEQAVVVLHGGMSDTDQQSLVEDFGRSEAPIRVLVASDVAAEGINLHYLSHRLIHFDIPWSLMIFQQRNGRIDRYGQTEKPDIRYLMTKTDKNEKIAGDARILEILVRKEEQAVANIGDPAALMGVYDPEAEEAITAQAIESGMDPNEFAAQLDSDDDDLADLMEQLIAGAAKPTERVRTKESRTLFTDLEYLKEGIGYFLREQRYGLQSLQTAPGVELTVNPELKRRLGRAIPEEAMPKDDTLRLSPDKEFCMEDMTRSLQNAIDEDAWPRTQYLWPLHPIFQWLHDKASLLMNRQEAPLIGLSEHMEPDDVLILIAGVIPNRRSAPVVDAWFGLHFRDGTYQGQWTMAEVLQRTRLDQGTQPNTAELTAQHLQQAQKLLAPAVTEAEKIMRQQHREYKARIDPLINAELEKLEELRQRHTEYIQLKLLEQPRKREERSRTVDAIFERYVDWVHNSLDIEERPYIRVLAAITGVK